MHPDALAVSYGITAAISLLVILLLIRTQSLRSRAALFVATVLFGALIFPRLEGIIQAIEWRLQNKDGTFTYMFVERTIEMSLSNPEYWALRFEYYSSAYWWLVWPVYFAMLYAIAALLKHFSNT